MKSIFLSTILLCILLSGFFPDVDDHTNGRGTRPFLRESMTENYPPGMGPGLSIEA